MPQDTTIYWDGEGQLPPDLARLPMEQQQQVLALVRRQKEDSYSDPTGTYLVLIIFIIAFSLAAIYSNRKTKRLIAEVAIPTADQDTTGAPTPEGPLVYTGANLQLPAELLAAVLIKRFSFYRGLDKKEQEKFIERLQRFITSKTFVIHDKSGFREMPILIGATAIQLSFGLDEYLLPNFRVINIFPAEFVGTEPFLRILIGNVSGNTINLSWKHLLEGFQYPADGQNLGMHEIAHALYYQNCVVQQNVDSRFSQGFALFDEPGNKVFELEKTTAFGLYSRYATKDFQEFWAETIELFFEKPAKLKTAYPDLYTAVSRALNQDPAGWSSHYIA